MRLETVGASVDTIHCTEDLAPGRTIVFSTTGITDGCLLHGVTFFKNGARTHSVTMGLCST